MGRLFRLSSITGQSAAHDGSRICAEGGHRSVAEARARFGIVTGQRPPLQDVRAQRSSEPREATKSSVRPAIPMKMAETPRI